MESSWSPPTSSTKRPRRRAVSAAARGRARCCRSRKSAATARNGTGRMPGERLPEWRDDFLGERVERVPAVGVARGGSERPLLAPAADPDGHAWLERLRIVRRVLEPEVRTVEVHAASLRVEEQAHALRVFLQHVLTDPDARELVAEGPGLDLVPAGAEAAVDAAAGEMVDRGERLRVKPGIPVGDAVDEGPEPDALRR